MDARLARRAPLGCLRTKVWGAGSCGEAPCRYGFVQGGEAVLGGASADKAAVRERSRAPDRRPGEDSAPERTPSPTSNKDPYGDAGPPSNQRSPKTRIRTADHPPRPI